MISLRDLRTVQSNGSGETAEEALAKDPKNVDAWISLGNMMMDSSRFSEAIDAYERRCFRSKEY